MGGGESYMDVKERCHRILMKLVGTRESVLVVAHKVILQVIMSYFLDIPAEKQRGRILKRNAPAHAQRFFDRWIPLEQRYFDALDVKGRCGLVLSADD